MSVQNDALEQARELLGTEEFYLDDAIKGLQRQLNEARGENERLRKLLQDAADDNDGAPSGHCCPNCPWCDGEMDRYSEDRQFVHADACPAYTPDGKVRT